MSLTWVKYIYPLFIYESKETFYLSICLLHSITAVHQIDIKLSMGIANDLRMYVYVSGII